MSTNVSKEEREKSTTGREQPKKWGAKILEGGEELEREWSRSMESIMLSRKYRARGSKVPKA